MYFRQNISLNDAAKNISSVSQHNTAFGFNQQFY